MMARTIHDDTDECKYKSEMLENMKPLCKTVQIVRYTWVLMARDKSNHLAAASLRSVPQESWS